MFEIRESSQYGAFLFSFESDSAKLNQTPIWIIWAISGWEVQPLQTSSCWWARERDAGRSHWDSWWLWLVQQIGRKGQESPWEEGRRLEGRDLCEEGWQSSLFFPPAMSSPNPPEIVAPFFSNLPNPQVWAPKTPSFSLPSSNLFPVPRYQRKGEALEWFCHKEKEKSKTPNQTKQPKLARVPFKIPSPKQGLSSSRMVRQRQSRTPSPVRKDAPPVWSSEVTPEVKKIPFWFPALPQLTKAALRKTPVSWQFVFSICETRVRWVIREKCSDAECKFYYYNFLQFPTTKNIVLFCLYSSLLH